MPYTLNGFFNIVAASDDAGTVRFLGGQAAQQGGVNLHAHSMHAERMLTTWHIVPQAEGNYTLSLMNTNTWRETYLCAQNGDSKQPAFAEEDDGRRTRWTLADAGQTGIGKSYVTIQNAASGEYVTAAPERSSDVGLDDKSIRDDTQNTGSLWQLLQLVTVDGPMTTWREEVEEPIESPTYP